MTADMSFSPLERQWLDEGLVDLSPLNVLVDMKYGSTKNVFNKKLYTDFHRPFGHPILAQKFEKATELLQKHHADYKLILWDALRPHKIQELMWDSIDIDEKENFIAPPHVSSIHNYGMAVDLAIFDLKNNILLDFGCEFDDFSEAAHCSYPRLTTVQKVNRNILKNIMQQSDFMLYANEWWHFEAMDKDFVKLNFKRY